MSDRAPGYYWVRTYGAGVPEIAEWRSRGILGGYEWASERREDIAERDIVVLAGPLQAPSESDSVRIGNVVLGVEVSARADSFNGSDLAYILGVHALLTELAKEET